MRQNINSTQNVPCTIELPNGQTITGKVDLTVYENVHERYHYNFTSTFNTDYEAEAKFIKQEDGRLFTIKKKKSKTPKQIKVEHRVMGPVDLDVITQAYKDVGAPNNAKVDIIQAAGMDGMMCIIFRWKE